MAEVPSPFYVAAFVDKSLVSDAIARDLTMVFLLSDQGQLRYGAANTRPIPIMAARLLTTFNLLITHARLTNDRVVAGTMVEALCHIAPEGVMMTAPLAQERFRTIITWLEREGIEKIGFTPAQWDECKGLVPGFLIANIANTPMATLATIIGGVANLMAEAQPIDPVLYYAHLVMAYAKRGHVTDGFVQKVSDGIRDQHGINLRISTAVIRTYWNCVSPWLPENINEFFAGLQAMFPNARTLRLGLTLQQAVGGGLTAYRVIGTAFRLHPGFYWDIIGTWFSDEVVNFRAALFAVGNNGYLLERRSWSDQINEVPKPGVGGEGDAHPY